MNVATFVVVLFAVLLVPFIAVLLYFWNRKSEKISAKYSNTAVSSSIFVKKYHEADVDYYRSAFLLLALCMALGILLLSFNFIPKAKDDAANLSAFVDEEEVEEIPQTNQYKPPPPPPPPPPEVIEVEDEEEIEEEPEIFEQEFEEDEVIEPPVIEEPAAVEEEPEEPEIFLVVEDMPEFPGGEKAMYEFLGKSINYPQVAKENGIEGKVYVQFVVDKRGKVTDYVVRRGIGGGCDEEAIKAVSKMPNWKPGKQRGKPVSVQFTIPVFFTLN